MSHITGESIGKQLRDARLKKQMTIADAARITHIRPESLVDLEKDDYSNFPSISYARGFLIIYGQLLHVDVTEAAAKFGNSSAVDIGEYEYLSGKPAPLTRSQGGGRKVLVFLAAAVSCILVVVSLLLHMVNTNSRLDALEPPSQAKEAAVNPTPAASAAPSAPPVAVPAPVMAASAIPVAVAVPLKNEIVLHPLKKTWVKIQKDSVDSAPVYEDWLYPDANGLTLRGGKFWIQLAEGDAVQITKSGQSIPYNSPGIVVE